MSNIPDLGQMLTRLEDLAQVKVDPDVPISQADLSSLDLLEWTVLLEDEYQVSLENIGIDELQNLTPRLLYESVLARQATLPGGRGDG
jgi:acyl carrier protein